jgi:hypothetical protein
MEGLRNMKKNLTSIIIALVVIVLFCTQSVFAETLPKGTFVPTELSAEDEASFNNAMEAAEAENWTIANRYFDTLHQKYPFYPPLIFNAALAKANSGQELAAIAWLHTYLAMVPESDNRAAILEEITRLKKATHNKSVKIFDNLAKSADKIPADKWGNFHDRNNSVDLLVQSVAEAGNIELAVTTKKKYYEQHENEDDRKKATETQKLKGFYARTLADIDKPDEARAILEKDDIDSEAWENVAAAYLRQNKYYKAWDVVVKKNLQNAWPIRYKLQELSLEKNDWAAMEIAWDKFKWFGYELIAEYVKRGEIDKARAIAETDARNMYMYQYLCTQLWLNGDIKLGKEIAKESLARLHKAYDDEGRDKIETEYQFVPFIALSGDFNKAKKLSLTMKQNPFQPTAHAKLHSTMTEILMSQGKLKEAKRMARNATIRKKEKYDPQYHQYTSHMVIAQALLDQGKEREGIKMAMSIKIDPKTGSKGAVNSFLSNIIEKRIERGDSEAALELMEIMKKKDKEYYEKSARTHQLLADIYIKSGDLKKVIKRHEEVVAILVVSNEKTRNEGTSVLIEKTLEKKFKFGVENGELKQEAVDWAILGIMLDHYGDLQKELKRSGKESSTTYDTPANVIKRSLLVPFSIKKILLKIEHLEEGDPIKSISHLVIK